MKTEGQGNSPKAALPKGKRVHHMRDGAPRCGGGRHGKRGPWQMELGDVTCRRCLKLIEQDRKRASHQNKQMATKEGNHR